MRLSEHHEKLTDGEGKCSVPMWSQGMPAGFCDFKAYGKQEPDQYRYGEHSRTAGKWIAGYCSGLACFNHGGPQFKVEPSTQSKKGDKP